MDNISVLSSYRRYARFYVFGLNPGRPEAVRRRKMKRVPRPGGSLYILNHFSQRGSLLSLMERALSPLTPLLGFEPLFYLDEFLDQAGIRGAADIPIQPFGYWRLLCFKNQK